MNPNMPPRLFLAAVGVAWFVFSILMGTFLARAAEPRPERADVQAAVAFVILWITLSFFIFFNAELILDVWVANSYIP